MAEQVLSISPANLSYIERNLNVLNENLGIVNGQLLDVNKRVEFVDGSLAELHTKHDDLEQIVKKFAEAFDDYMGEYRRNHNLQLAQTEIISVKQDLEQKFGYYGEIRKMATGILQGVDNRLVTSDTLQYATEEAMIKAPGYWLAPTLVCVASWLRNDKETAERAVRESIRRDDYKTSLFFTLLCNRINRNESVLKWIERYFQHQNPRDLDREFMIILESISTGVLPPASRDMMVRFVKQWVTELTETDDFIDQQKDQWIGFFNAKKESEEQSQYHVLKQFAGNWAELNISLQLAKANKAIFAHFNKIISSGVNSFSSLKKQLDILLNSLVTNFDDEELPLRKKFRECELIIEKGGDKDAALAVMSAEEKIFNEKVDLLQLLTNAAFNPEKSGASTSTQALALSISQPWVIEGYNTFTATYRVGIPTQVEFDIDGWKESTVDGSDEQDLLYKQGTYYEKVKDELIAQAKFPWKDIIIPIILIVFGVYASFGKIYFLAGPLIGAVWIYRIWKKNEDYKNSIDEQVEEKKVKAAEVLRGLLAETVEYRQEVKTEDNESENVLNFLNQINSDQFMNLSKGSARSIIK